MMQAIWGLIAALLALSFTCSDLRADEAIYTESPIDTEAVRKQIEKNWFIDFELAEACPKAFQLHVTLKPGGVVQDVALNGQPVNEKACSSLVEAAKRAIMISSPLPVPSDVTSLDMNFDIPSVISQ